MFGFLACFGSVLLILSSYPDVKSSDKGLYDFIIIIIIVLQPSSVLVWPPAVQPLQKDQINQVNSQQLL